MTGLTYKYAMAAVAAARASRKAPSWLSGATPIELWGHGEQDGLDPTKTANYLTNLGTHFAAKRTALGWSTLRTIIWKLHTSSGVANAAGIRTAQTTFIAGDAAHYTAYDPSSHPLSGDGLHMTDVGAEGVGIDVAALVNSLVPSGDILFLIDGQSNVFSQTSTRIATDPKFQTVVGAPAYQWCRGTGISDLRHKTLPWQDYTSRKYYPFSTQGRNWPGAPEVAAWHLKNTYSRRLAVIQVSEGGTDLANDWAA